MVWQNVLASTTKLHQLNCFLKFRADGSLLTPISVTEGWSFVLLLLLFSLNLKKATQRRRAARLTVTIGE